MAGKKTRSYFCEVKCRKCKNVQIVFSHASSYVKCLVCNEELAKPTGGKVELKGELVRILEN